MVVCSQVTNRSVLPSNQTNPSASCLILLLSLQLSNTPCLGAGTGVDETVTRGFAFGTAIGRRLFFLAMHNVSTESAARCVRPPLL